MRAELLRVKDVAKVELLGVQDEKIYLEFSAQQMGALGIDANTLMQTLQLGRDPVGAACEDRAAVDAEVERLAGMTVDEAWAQVSQYLHWMSTIGG